MLSFHTVDELAAGASRPVLDLDTLYREHAADVSRWVKRLWGARDAEDLLHEVFLVVQRRLPEFRAESSARTWLYAITLRVVSSRRRQARLRRLLLLRATPELQEERSPAASPLGSAVREETASMVYAVLEKLSERDRTLLISFELEGLPASELTVALGISETNLWVSLHRARTRFRNAYWKRFGRQLGV